MRPFVPMHTVVGDDDDDDAFIGKRERERECDGLDGFSCCNGWVVVFNWT